MGVRNGRAIRAYSFALAERVERIVGDGGFPVVLGGDCSILLGAMLGLRRIGRFALAFVDGHVDFLTPETSSTKGVAGMDLAIATGRGPTPLTGLAGQGSLVRDEDVAVLGCRDAEAGTTGTEALDGTPILALSAADIGAEGVGTVAARALERLERPDTAGFWVHVDADVLDEAVMPAVDAPQPGGLDLDELAELLGALLSSERAIGLELTIFDPVLEPDGTLAAALTEVVVQALASGRSDPLA